VKGVIPKSQVNRGNFSEFRNKNLRITPAKEKKDKTRKKEPNVQVLTTSSLRPQTLVA
jgi:hypothetical protein